MKTRFLITVMVLFILMTFMGCESITGNKGGPPNPYMFGMKAYCGGAETNVDGPFIGSKAYFYFDFYTGNVNEDFEMSVLIDSPSVPPALRPDPPTSVLFTTNSKDTFSGKGSKRAAFWVSASCYSAGPYTVTVIITDPHGDSGYSTADFVVGESTMFGGDPCKCTTQCGECTESHYLLRDRCICGCPLYDEKCKD